MNSNADNYDATADQDDGSCVISGCIDANANNYNVAATEDDGSCTFNYICGYGTPHSDADASTYNNVNKCEACNSGFYLNIYADNCQAQKTCGNQLDGSGRLSGESATAAGSCDACDANTYAASDTDNCQSHTSCGNQLDGSTRLSGESATAAGSCDACDENTYAASDTDNCQAHTPACAPFWIVTQTPSTTQDRICEFTCPDGRTVRCINDEYINGSGSQSDICPTGRTERCIKDQYVNE